MFSARVLLIAAVVVSLTTTLSNAKHNHKKYRTYLDGEPDKIDKAEESTKGNEIDSERRGKDEGFYDTSSERPHETDEEGEESDEEGDEYRPHPDDRRDNDNDDDNAADDDDDEISTDADSGETREYRRDHHRPIGPIIHRHHDPHHMVSHLRRHHHLTKNGYQAGKRNMVPVYGKPENDGLKEVEKILRRKEKNQKRKHRRKKHKKRKLYTYEMHMTNVKSKQNNISLAPTIQTIYTHR